MFIIRGLLHVLSRIRSLLIEIKNYPIIIPYAIMVVIHPILVTILALLVISIILLLFVPIIPAFFFFLILTFQSIDDLFKVPKNDTFLITSSIAFWLVLFILAPLVSPYALIVLGAIYSGFTAVIVLITTQEHQATHQLR